MSVEYVNGSTVFLVLVFVGRKSRRKFVGVDHERAGVTGRVVTVRHGHTLLQHEGMETVFTKDYHMNLPTPSLSLYRNTHMVAALIAAYHRPSSATPHPGTSLTCALSRTYGMRK